MTRDDLRFEIADCRLRSSQSAISNLKSQIQAVILLIVLIARPSILFADPEDASAIGRAFRSAAERAGPSVVAVEVDRVREEETPAEGGAALNRIYREFFTRPAGPASGFVLEPDGWILTSYYDVAGEIRKIVVRVPGRPPMAARLVGFDQVRDIALLKIEATGLPALARAPRALAPKGAGASPEARRAEGEGSPSGPAVGETLIVLGRSPDPDRLTVNAGIVSAAARHEGTALQTDAEMNYGDAGGPAIDLEGRLVGIACHIGHKTMYGQSSGIGFVTTASAIDERIARLKKGEKILKPREAWLGIQPAEGAEDAGGVQVHDVLQGSPAEEAGLKPKDAILEFDGEPVSIPEELMVILKKHKPGDEVKVKVKRGDREIEIKVKLGEKP